MSERLKKTWAAQNASTDVQSCCHVTALAAVLKACRAICTMLPCVACAANPAYDWTCQRAAVLALSLLLSLLQMILDSRIISENP